MKFKPSNDYAELRKQAHALATLVKCQEKAVTYYKDKAIELKLKLALVDKKALEAERENNEQLTCAIEELEDKYLRMLREQKASVTVPISDGGNSQQKTK